MTPDEIVRALRNMLPEPVDYAELVGSPVPSSYGHHFAYEDPEPYIIEEAADLIESLQADLRHEEKVSHGQMEQNKRLRKMVDKLQANLAESLWRGRTLAEEIIKALKGEQKQ